MNKFTKLILNGVEKFIAAIYDGNGNQIDTTYETIANVASKETTLSERIDTTNQTISALTERVVTTENFKASIDKNAEDIVTNSSEITALKEEDVKLKQDLENLTIEVGENSEKITSALTNSSAASSSVLLLNNEVATLKGIVNDGATGVNALNNTKADKTTVEALAGRVTVLETAKNDLNTALSGKVAQTDYDAKVEDLTTSLGTKVEQETFLATNAQVESNKTSIEGINTGISAINESLKEKASQTDLTTLIARVEALEAALAANHPTESPGSEGEATE